MSSSPSTTTTGGYAAWSVNRDSLTATLAVLLQKSVQRRAVFMPTAKPCAMHPSPITQTVASCEHATLALKKLSSHVGARAALPGLSFAGPLDQAAHAHEDVLEGLRQLAARLRLWEDDHPTWPREAPAERGGAGAPTSRADRVRRWIQVHHRSECRLNDLADELGLSPSQTSRAVRISTGRGFAELVVETRLTTARALLVETDLPVIDVAIRSGFGDRSHFHRVFRKAFGVSPHHWRQQGPAQRA